jgi:phosphonate ABC transporter permease subunit PhnE
MKKPTSTLRSIGVGLAVILVVVVYAYGFQVTKIDFKETRSPDRLLVLTRILRALAHPDILAYDYEETNVETAFYLPCPEGETPPLPEPNRSGPYITTDVSCAASKETVLVKGYNFQGNSQGPINFIFSSGAKTQLGNFQADANGSFELSVDLPMRQPVAEAQIVRATGRVKVGSPHLTSTAITTWDKIVETVFLAFLATTFGTLLSIPISFIAARNLMSEVKSPLSNFALTLLGWPIGLGLGAKLAIWMRNIISKYLGDVLPGLAAAVVFLVIGYLIFRWIFSQGEDHEAGLVSRSAKILAEVAIGVFLLAVLIIVSNFLVLVGNLIAPALGKISFLGSFVYQWGDIFQMITPVISALVVGSIIGGLFGNVGQKISDRFSETKAKLFNLIVTPISFASLFVIILQGVDWFYQFNNPAITLWWPAGIGLALGLGLAVLISPDKPLPSGMILYTVTRTILNMTRSVEPLIMGIVFVAWVGLGPFAGALALGLHTIAALAKLYSEQVESILSGPLEAVMATGANRLQTIVYAVVPQIIPPYISFTMYRWDINVRMSTIIGFVGGGGIGFVLQQNINLLNYRAASCNMLAIAIVVASMDYISSSLRERFV